MVVLERGLQNEERQAPEYDKNSHRDGQAGSALLAFAFFESVTAMAFITSGALVRMLFQETSEADQNLFGIHADKAAIRIHEPANERFRGQLNVLIGLEQMEQADADLRRGSDLLNGNPSALTLVPEVFP